MATNVFTSTAPPAASPFLRDILRVHRRFAKETTIPACFGDGYLQKHNRVCRNVRAAVLAIGYTLTAEDVGDYRALPLAALGSILRGKQIPYIPTERALFRIEQRRPGKFRLDEILQPVQNQVLHESAHCLAHVAMAPQLFATLPVSQNRRLTLRGLFGEACANATEAFAWLDVTTPEHGYFLRMNSYLPADPNLKLIRTMAVEFEREAVFRTMVYCFLYANFLYRDIDDGDRAVIAKASGLESYPKASSRKLMQGIGNWAVKLNASFRLETTPFYLKLQHAVDEDVFKLLDFPFMRVIQKNAAITRAFDKFVSQVVGPA